jgi:DNA repair exonuclease SbcCD ATPase subunit
MTPYLAVLAATGLMIAPLAAQAQKRDEQYTYRCTGKDAKKYYGQTIPPACLGQPLELINKQGMVVKRIDREGDEKARLAKEAEEQKRRETELAQKDAQRRHRALLATYTSEKDIEEARGRALREHHEQLQEVETRIEAIKKRQARHEKDLELYSEGAKGAPPARLKEEVTNAEIDLKAQETLLAAKKKEAEGINARYDDDRRRYREATGVKRR